jgi:cellulose synthase/poly-beta-1,6-N-acetylglucosamine synthase-like glycosyltransferase
MAVAHAGLGEAERVMIVSVLLVVFSLPVLAWTGYLALLSLLSRAVAVPVTSRQSQTRFDIVVPAHDEEAGIAATVRSLEAVDYPRECRRVIVIADNCSDTTAACAAEAGAVVLERRDEKRRGKGYALAHAFERSLADGVADAIVVVDADTVVSPNLLRAFDARFQAGAPAAQAHYAVANPNDSWRTRLMHIGFTLFHDVRSRGRERLGVSAGLRGNGMAFAVGTLREVPHDAFSVVEDVEYGIRLGLAGHRVFYAGEAQVYGAMVSSERASRSQRQRWEGGRWALVRRHGAALLANAAARRSAVLLDLALDLLVPPLSYVALATALGTLVACVSWALGVCAAWAVWPWLLCALGFATYLVRGIWLARVGVRGVLDLCWAPVYVVWKVALALRPSSARRGEWVRTTREEANRP